VFTDTSVSVVVEDDGLGFDLKTVAESKDKSRGLGLLGMRERAALLGGKATIESQPGRGTRVAVEIPLEEQDGQR
jgi:signal transduction histidine kinase